MRPAIYLSLPIVALLYVGHITQQPVFLYLQFFLLGWQICDLADLIKKGNKRI